MKMKENKTDVCDWQEEDFKDSYEKSFNLQLNQYVMRRSVLQ